MFSKELEEIIEAALADGVITDKERAVLHKRATLEGVDPDELDVVIEGRLAKTKKQEDWLRPTPPQNLANEKHGNVVKCPSCGAQVDRTKAICPECGYAFTNVSVTRSLKYLFKKIEKADDVKERSVIIANAPIPTSKEDILEFLSAAVPNATIVNPITGTKIGRMKLGLACILILMTVAYIITLIGGGESELGSILGSILGFIALYGLMGIVAYVQFGGNASDNEHNQLASAWKSKSEQIVIKARFALRDDKKTLEEIEHYAQLIGIKKK